MDHRFNELTASMTVPHQTTCQNLFTGLDVIKVYAGRGLDDLVFDKDANGVNEYMLRWGFETACQRAGIPFGETTPGGIIWHDLRRTFATRGAHEYDIQDLLGHSKPGVTTV